MKRVLAGIGLVLLLAGCNNATVSHLTLSFNVSDPAQLTELTNASVRVIQRRLQAVDKKLLGSSIDAQGSTVVLTLRLSDADSVASIEGQLSEPFSMAIMRQTGEKETPDVTVEKRGGFTQTGITEKQIAWVTVGTDAGTGKGSAVITFTPEGQTMLRKVFTENRGKFIGIFVRGKLVSQKVVTAGDTQGSILIDNIPSTEIANIFADDVNVGLHVTFTAGK